MIAWSLAKSRKDESPGCQTLSGLRLKSVTTTTCGNHITQLENACFESPACFLFRNIFSGRAGGDLVPLLCTATNVCQMTDGMRATPTQKMEIRAWHSSEFPPSAFYAWIILNIYSMQCWTTWLAEHWRSVVDLPCKAVFFLRQHSDDKDLFREISTSPPSFANYVLLSQLVRTGTGVENSKSKNH